MNNKSTKELIGAVNRATTRDIITKLYSGKGVGISEANKEVIMNRDGLRSDLRTFTVRAGGLYKHSPLTISSTLELECHSHRDRESSNGDFL